MKGYHIGISRYHSTFRPRFPAIQDKFGELCLPASPSIFVDTILMDLTSELSCNSRADHPTSSPSLRRSTNRSPPRLLLRCRSSSTVSPLVLIPPGSSGAMKKTAQLMTLPRQLATTVDYEELGPVKGKLNRCDVGLGVVAVLFMALAWVQNEEGYRAKKDQIGLNIHAIRGLCMASVLISWGMLYQRYELVLQLLKLSHTVDIDSKG